MVAFGIVLDRHLPIAVLRNFDPFQRLELGPIRHPFFQFGPSIGEPFVHRGRIRIEVDEHEAKELLGARFTQADAGRVETFNRLDIGTGAQFACQFIGPRMIGTDDDAFGAGAVDQLVRAVLADVVEDAYFAVAPADREQALSGDLEGRIISWLRQFRRMASKLPRACHKALGFQTKHFWIGIVLGCQ